MQTLNIARNCLRFPTVKAVVTKTFTIPPVLDSEGKVLVPKRVTTLKYEIRIPRPAKKSPCLTVAAELAFMKKVCKHAERIFPAAEFRDGFDSFKAKWHARRMKRDQAAAICRREGVFQPTEGQLEAAYELTTGRAY